MDNDALLDRAATRRVLRRASELAHADLASTDPDGLDDQTLVGAAVEAGIPERDVRRAVAVERLGRGSGPSPVCRA